MADTPRRFVDLHTHSNASDGQLSPAQLVRLADQAKLAALALTDHDTVAGVDAAREAAGAFPHLKLIAGIEISARFPHGTLHILGLGLAQESDALKDLTRQMQAARGDRNPQILRRLGELGLPVSMEEVAQVAGMDRPGGNEVLGRLHIAAAMLRKGYVDSTAEAFAKYLGTGQAAYVDKERFSPREAIEAIHAAGGLAVLAHPPQLCYENTAQLERIVREFIHAGLDGIEAYHSDNTPQQTRLYVDLATRLKLGITGGSDFHGGHKPDVALGYPRVPLSALGERFTRHLLGD